MKKHLVFINFLGIVFLLVAACTSSIIEKESELSNKGNLFIIGGGSKPPELIKKLVETAMLDSQDYAIILPMASQFPDTAIHYDSLMFISAGVKKVEGIRFDLLNTKDKNLLDKLAGAKLIYISGGDQASFMQIIANSTIKAIIQNSYFNGATIAGTSAGAALMSEKMITGSQIKHPIYTGDFKTIEANNIELAEGLGLISNVIIDQHFIKRQRMNRLIAVSLENPAMLCIGIDEATAIIVNRSSIEVAGISQVIVLKHNKAETKIVNGLLGGQNLDISIFLPGDKFSIKQY